MRRSPAAVLSRASLGLAIFVTVAGVGIRAEDWPEIRGKGRLGEWNETGIVDKFPAGGLNVLWRTPIRAGFAGPSVADGRVFVTDFAETQRPRGTERALALDEKTGKILWTQEWTVDYRGMSYADRARAARRPSTAIASTSRELTASCCV